MSSEPAQTWTVMHQKKKVYNKKKMGSRNIHTLRDTEAFESCQSLYWNSLYRRQCPQMPVVNMHFSSEKIYLPQTWNIFFSYLSVMSDA